MCFYEDKWPSLLRKEQVNFLGRWLKNVYFRNEFTKEKVFYQYSSYTECRYSRCGRFSATTNKRFPTFQEPSLQQFSSNITLTRNGLGTQKGVLFQFLTGFEGLQAIDSDITCTKPMTLMVFRLSIASSHKALVLCCSSQENMCFHPFQGAFQLNGFQLYRVGI